MEKLTSGFHPACGCIARFKEQQEQINTDFRDLRARFAKGFPAAGSIPALSPASLGPLLSSIIENAPLRLRELKQQLADCLYWELKRHGEHVCAGYEVSEASIRALYTELKEEPMWPIAVYA